MKFYKQYEVEITLLLCSIMTAVSLLMSGCAGGMAKTVDGTRRAMVVLDVAVDESAAAWEHYVAQQIGWCREQELTTEQQRAACLGPAARADKVRDAVAAIVQAQKAMADALDRLAEVAPALDEVRQ